MESLLRRQWEALRRWLDAVDIQNLRDRPSGLGTWTLGDLVAHLGLGIGMVAEVTAAPPGTVPLSLGKYVAAYPPAAHAIAAQTQHLARDLGEDLLAGIDAIAVEAWRALERGLDPVVLGRRGPLTRHDYLTTRLIELVVHGDDLERTVRPANLPSPLLGEALDAVSAALARAYQERSDSQPDTTDKLAWIRLAAGRDPDRNDPYLPLL